VTSRRLAVLLVLAGSALALAARGRPWVGGRLVGGVDGGLAAAGQVSASGAVAVPGLTALALVAAAGAVVLATAGRAVRRFSAALVLLAGGVMVAGVIRVMLDPGRALRAAAVEEALTSVSASGLSSVTPTGWIVVALAGAAAVLGGGVITLLRSSTWADPSSRYERDESRDEPLWDSLSRGEDPT
jgi:hypothetical protein